MSIHKNIIKWVFVILAVDVVIYAVLLFTGVIYDDTWTPRFYSYLKLESWILIFASLNVALMFFHQEYQKTAFQWGKVLLLLLVVSAYFKYQIFIDENTGLVNSTYYDGMGHNVTTFYDNTDLIDSMKYTYWIQLVVSLVSVLYMNWVEKNVSE